MSQPKIDNIQMCEPLLILVARSEAGVPEEHDDGEQALGGNSFKVPCHSYILFFCGSTNIYLASTSATNRCWHYVVAVFVLHNL